MCTLRYDIGRTESLHFKRKLVPLPLDLLQPDSEQGYLVHVLGLLVFLQQLLLVLQ